MNHDSEQPDLPSTSERYLFLAVGGISLILLAVNTGVRFYKLDTLAGFSGDEAAFAWETLQPGIKLNPYASYHGPYYLVMLKVAFGLFGASAAAARLVSVISIVVGTGIAALIVRFYCRSTDGLSRPVARMAVLCSATCFSSLPLFFVLSRIAMPYAIFPLTIASAILLFELAIHRNRYFLAPCGLILGISFGMHPMPLLLVPPFLFTFLWVRRDRASISASVVFLGSFLLTSLPNLKAVLTNPSGTASLYSPIEFYWPLFRLIAGDQTYNWIAGVGWRPWEEVIVLILLALLSAAALRHLWENRTRREKVAVFILPALASLLLYFFTKGYRLNVEGHERFIISLMVFLPLLLSRGILLNSKRWQLIGLVLCTLLNLMFTWGNVARFLIPLSETGGLSETTFRTNTEVEPRAAALDFIVEQSPDTDSCSIVVWDLDLLWALRFHSAKAQRQDDIRTGFPNEWQKLKDSDAKSRFVVMYTETQERRLYFDALVNSFFDGAKVSRASFEQQNGNALIYVYRIN
jgi:hypothetical protein